MLCVCGLLHGLEDPLQVTESLVSALSEIRDLLYLVNQRGHYQFGQAGPQPGEFEVWTHLARDKDLQELVPQSLGRRLQLHELTLAVCWI